MASPSAATTATTAATKLGSHLPRLRDIIDHDDEDDDFVEEEVDEEEEEEWENMSKRMSRLSVEGSDGGDADDEDDGYLRGEEEEEEEDGEEVRSSVNGEYVAGGCGGGQWHPYGDDDPRNPQAPSSASLPGTPDRGAPAPSPWLYSKEYASETEAARWPGGGGGGGGGGEKRRMRHRRERMMREVWLDQAWQMRKQRRQILMQGQGLGADAVTVVVSAGGESLARGGGVAMDMEEMRACRDLGLDLPCDWTMEIPCYALSGVDTASSGGNSPASGSWRISSPGDDPKDVKARLKVWAQAVALASASRLGS